MLGLPCMGTCRPLCTAAGPAPCMPPQAMPASTQVPCCYLETDVMSTLYTNDIHSILIYIYDIHIHGIHIHSVKEPLVWLVMTLQGVPIAAQIASLALWSMSQNNIVDLLLLAMITLRRLHRTFQRLFLVVACKTWCRLSWQRVMQRCTVCPCQAACHSSLVTDTILILG